MKTTSLGEIVDSAVMVQTGYKDQQQVIQQHRLDFQIEGQRLVVQLNVGNLLAVKQKSGSIKNMAYDSMNTIQIS